MSALGQKVLLSHVADVDALGVLAREGLDEACIPDEQLRKVVMFSLRYYHQSGRERAPSAAVITQEFGDLLNDHEIALGEAEESIEWAIDDLKGTFVHKEAATFNKAFATAMAEADTADRIDVLNDAATDLVSLALRMESREVASDAREGLAERMTAYHERVANRDNVDGIRFGLPVLDDYVRGIRPGELAVLAAPPKTGKSYLLDYIALVMWRLGAVVCLYTLENSVEMTLDRIACLATGVDSSRWMHGECEEYEVERVRQWIEDMQASPVPLWVLQPDSGKRSAAMMVRDAQLRGASIILIDQLTFMEHEDSSKARHEQIGESLRTLKVLISTGRHRLACMIAHQINREGVKAADKSGYLEMWHVAESADVERTPDWVFGLYQSRDALASQSALFQTLAARRAALQHYTLGWNINAGGISVRAQTDPYTT